MTNTPKRPTMHCQSNTKTIQKRLFAKQYKQNDLGWSVFTLSCIQYCSYIKWISFRCFTNIYWSNGKMTPVLYNYNTEYTTKLEGGLLLKQQGGLPIWFWKNRFSVKCGSPRSTRLLTTGRMFYISADIPGIWRFFFFFFHTILVNDEKII